MNDDDKPDLVNGRPYRCTEPGCTEGALHHHMQAGEYVISRSALNSPALIAVMDAAIAKALATRAARTDPDALGSDAA